MRKKLQSGYCDERMCRLSRQTFSAAVSLWNFFGEPVGIGVKALIVRKTRDEKREEEEEESVEATSVEVLLDEHVDGGVQHELDLSRVRRARLMRVDLQSTSLLLPSALSS